MRHIKEYFAFLKKIDIKLFIYLNFFCENIIRTDNSKIIPYKCVVIDIGKNSKIYVGGGDIEIGCDLMKKSKTETRIRLRDDSIWNSNGGCKISYGSTIELLNSAILDTRYFTMNSFSTLVISKKIVIGQDVMISRNVILYDSDFHSLMDEKGKIKNFPKPVIINDHVWISAKVMILKGTKIGLDSVIGAGSIVREEIPDRVIYHTIFEGKNRVNKGTWCRKRPEEEL